MAVTKHSKEWKAVREVGSSHFKMLILAIEDHIVIILLGMQNKTVQLSYASHMPIFFFNLKTELNSTEFLILFNSVSNHTLSFSVRFILWPSGRRAVIMAMWGG